MAAPTHYCSQPESGAQNDGCEATFDSLIAP